jgi:hypothetical protein
LIIAESGRLDVVVHNTGQTEPDSLI